MPRAILAPEQNVGGLDVAVYEADGVCCVEPGGDLRDDVRRVHMIEPPRPADERLQVRARDPTHQEVEPSVLLTGAVHGNDVRMLDCGGHPGLPFEARAEVRVCRSLGGDELQRDGPVEPELGGSIDHTHTAAASYGFNAAAGEGRVEGQIEHCRECDGAQLHRIVNVTDVQASLEEYRGIREALETAVLPLATSVDGRRFNFQVSLHGLEFEPGGYVAIEGNGARRLGQLLSLELRHQDATAPGLGAVRVRAGGGEGVVLDGDGRPFHDADVRRATPEEVGAWLERTRPDGAQLDVAELALSDGVPFRLDADGFGRHTFMCGQSGSGKTYSLGVLLERLLMETNLRVVVLDPNSDYVRLGEPRVDDDRYTDAAASVQVRGGSGAPEPIRIRFRELSPAHQAGLLRLDPLADRAEYGELLGLIEDDSIRSLEDLAKSPAEDLKLRARNLGIDRFGIWPGPEGESLLDELVSPTGPRCLVVDLGALGTREEQTLTAGAVLERLWRERARREPVAIVIDEAQNVCPAEAADPLTALAMEDAIRIAGRGSQVRALPDRGHPAPTEDPRERALAVRQPGPDADELGGRSRPRGRGVFVRAAGFGRPCDGLPPGRGTGRGQDRFAPGAGALRLADQLRGRG